MERPDGRDQFELRKIEIIPQFLPRPDGNALIRWGNTVVLAYASLKEGVPPFLIGTGRGWLTAEYSLLPAATQPRGDRESTRGRLHGRTVEIQRIIGRSLRMALDFEKLGENTFYIDCEVLQADGGTRCAAITAGWVALKLAAHKLVESGVLESDPVSHQICALSVIIDEQGQIRVDPDYEEDSVATVDMNVSLLKPNHIVDIQATAEHGSMTEEQCVELMQHALSAATTIFDIQSKAVEAFLAQAQK